MCKVFSVAYANVFKYEFIITNIMILALKKTLHIEI